uniref:Fibronectin type-III domain-containing protein n=1 Tax=Poecilia mexicana TaxID=48701 RepID=A0A3B3YZ07_9TELE
ETGAEWQNHTAPADARSLVVSGLSPGTWYKAALYGVHTGALLEPVFADTITGTDAVSSGASLFFLHPIYFLMMHHLPMCITHSVIHAQHLKERCRFFQDL